jgi:hypothetical protein
MSIISKPGTILKDQDNIFGLNKATLAGETKVSTDPYFSDQANWNRVIVAYLTDVGNQVEFVSFDATLGSPTANFRVSAKARDLWQVDALIIKDFDGGYLRFERDELTTADFDVDFAAAPPVMTGYFSNDFDIGLSSYEGYYNGSTGSGPESLSGTLFLNDDASGNMSYTLRVHDDVSTISGYVESDTSKPLIIVDDLVTGVEINFDITTYTPGGAGNLPVGVRVRDDLFSTASAFTSGVFITGTGNYTVSVSKTLMELNNVTSISEIVLEISGGSTFSQVGLDNVVITADQTSGDIIEQNVVVGAIRSGAAAASLDGETFNQTFSHNANFTIEQVQLHMNIYATLGGDSRAATVLMEVYDTDGITVLGSKQKVIDVVPGNTGPSWQAFKFDTPIAGLISGGNYKFVLSTINGFSGSDLSTSTLEVTYNNSDTYDNGHFFTPSVPALGDCSFRIIGTEV